MNPEITPAHIMLNEILHAMEVIDRVSKNEFFEDERFQGTVFYNLIVIGETSGDLIRDYPKLVMNHPAIPFHYARSLRNRIAHDYTGIDIGVIWATIVDQFPRFKSGVSRALARLDR